MDLLKNQTGNGNKVIENQIMPNRSGNTRPDLFITGFSDDTDGTTDELRRREPPRVPGLRAGKCRAPD